MMLAQNRLFYTTKSGWTNQCFLMDYSGIFDKNKAYLDSYPDLIPFFKSLCVPEKPSIRDVIEKLEEISKCQEVNEKQVEAIYEFLGKEVIYGEVSYSLKDMVHQHKLIWHKTEKKWLDLSLLIWKSDNLYQYIIDELYCVQKMYPMLEYFFCNILRIERELSPSIVFKLWVDKSIQCDFKKYL